MSLEQLLNTSVSDLKSTLECRSNRDPAGAARDAIDLLEALQGKPNQSSRRKVAAAALRKAVKLLSEDSSENASQS